MATVADCEQALHELADRLSTANGSAKQHTALDRTLSCTIRDLGVVFTGHLLDGELIDIKQASSPEAQIRMAMSSDDLLKLVAGELHMASAWAGGRVRIDAGLRDLLRLRTVF